MNEKDAAIIDLLKRDDQTVHLSNGYGRRLIWNEFYDRWEILERNKTDYRKRILLTSDLQEALLTLVQE